MFPTAARRGLCVAILAVFAFVPAFSATPGNESKRVLKVMTRNMDAGTDLNLIFALYPDLTKGVNATLAEVVASDPPARAARLAEEIRTSGPDIVALQEVTLWGKGDCASPAVLYDQLQLLLDALEARNMHYTALATQDLTSVALPDGSGACVSFTDRDSILVRTELRPTGIEVSNVKAAQYATKLDLAALGFAGFPVVVRGYLSADVQAGSGAFRLVTTHLESTYPTFDPNGAIQVAQADELIAALKASTLPVLLCGDFNSNAETGPEHTATVAHILDAGFADVWGEFNPAGTGFTWPLFLEDVAPGASTATTPNERIDLIFSRGVRALTVDLTGEKAPYASDHAGVAASAQIGATVKE